jgi:hypothetical protein
MKKNLISKKKEIYSIQKELRDYLARFGRIREEGIRYEDLLRFDNSISLCDETGKDTFWLTVFYPPTEQREVYEQLRATYAVLKAHSDPAVIEHLDVDRVDMCTYGNTLPFRVRIINKMNENIDYFYVKRADANRVYGLELEHILSRNRLYYFLVADTIIEEHIVGIPADMFMRDYLPNNRFDKVRLLKEFVKFNERCLVRLLGDMHSGNFVVDITRDFEKWHYFIRAIDFDQQSHHWKLNVYRPQFFQQNNPIIEMGLELLDVRSVNQYRREERALMAERIKAQRTRLEYLLDVMMVDRISTNENISRLAKQLAHYYKNTQFLTCECMGELVNLSLDIVVAEAGNR